MISKYLDAEGDLIGEQSAQEEWYSMHFVTGRMMAHLKAEAAATYGMIAVSIKARHVHTVHFHE